MSESYIKIIKPTIEPKKTKEEFLKQFCRAWNLSQRNVCSHCKSYGWIYDPHDPRDVVEGNKLRNTIDCPKCSGTGIGNEYENDLLYEAYSDNYDKLLSDYKHRLIIYASIVVKLSKYLTDEELNFCEIRSTNK